jgi:hypothetical protein
MTSGLAIRRCLEVVHSERRGFQQETHTVISSDPKKDGLLAGSGARGSIYILLLRAKDL